MLVASSGLLAACGADVPPSASNRAATATPSPSVAPSSDAKFTKMSYPADGDAPCGQDKAPDAKHGPYRGNLKRIEAKDPTTVVFDLCGPDVAFLSKIASPSFAINDTGWLQSHLDPKATTQPIETEVNGTGPYRLERWDHGTEISLARNDSYWGTPARNERVIVRWRDSASERVVELQGATVDGIDQLDAPAVETVQADVNLQLEPRAGMNTVYLGFNNTFNPFNDEQVRRALAIGIDRQKLVDSFFPAGSERADYVTPCGIPNGCGGTAWYGYDPLLAKELLTAAGFPNGFSTTIHYPDTPPGSSPDMGALAEEVQAELQTNFGITAELVGEPADTYAADVEAGKLDGLHLMSQAGGYPDPSGFLDPQFGSGSKEFGRPMADVARALADGRGNPTPSARASAYAKANSLIHDHVPLIPIGHVGSTSAYLGDVDGAAASPLGVEQFSFMTPGDRRQLVWLTTNEPAGLYCADETDPVANLVCAQLSDSLYEYQADGASVEPALARTCAPNKDASVWTCKLRTGVKFQDGSSLDADDVVMSYAVQWDADNPLHVGDSGRFTRMASWFGGLLNPPAAP